MLALKVKAPSPWLGARGPSKVIHASHERATYREAVLALLLQRAVRPRRSVDVRSSKTRLTRERAYTELPSRFRLKLGKLVAGGLWRTDLFSAQSGE